MSETLNLEENFKKEYERFIDKIIENDTVWGLKLKNEDEWAFSSSEEYEDVDVMVFWSDKDEAKACVKEDWNDYEPTQIPLEIFMKNWLTGLDEDGLLVGVNWNSDLIGLESEPIELLNDIANKINEK